MNIPRNLIGVTWFRDAATINPVSYLLECVRSLIITGWDGEALALGFGIAALVAIIGADAGRACAAPEARPMRNLTVAQAVAWRTLHNVFTNKALVIPQLAFPLFFFAAFAGGLSRIHNVPGFDFPRELHVVPVRLRAAPVGRVRRRLHRLRHRARLRGRLRASG